MQYNTIQYNTLHYNTINTTQCLFPVRENKAVALTKTSNMLYCCSESRGRIGRARVVSQLVQVVCQADQSTQYLAMWSSYELKILHIHNTYIYNRIMCLFSLVHKTLRKLCAKTSKNENKARTTLLDVTTCGPSNRHRYFRGLLPPLPGYAGGGTFLRYIPTYTMNYVAPHPHRPQSERSLLQEPQISVLKVGRTTWINTPYVHML